MKTIQKKSTLFLYAASGCGVNLLNLIVTSYLCDALMTQGFSKNIEIWTYLNKTLVVAGIWSVLVLVAKIVDGLIDIPLASLTDNLRSRFGRRRPSIVMGMIPMIAAYLLFLLPLTNGESLLNTIWFGFLLCLFYSAYTLVMVTYYATFSEIVDNEQDRLRLSNYKSTFDIIYFVVGYALIPLLVGNLNIRTIALICLPFVLTMLIPLFLIKEPSSLKKDQPELAVEKQVGMIESLKYTFKNGHFWLWMGVYCALQFCLQLFLTAQNVYYSGTLLFVGWQITVLTACVFAPVPLTLLLYNKIVHKFGFRVGYLYSIGTFIVAMCAMSLAATLPQALRLPIACLGALCASFGVGSFFSVGYVIPSALAHRDAVDKGVSHPAMYFAVQGLFSGLATAVAVGPVWINLKNAGLSFAMPYLVIAAAVASAILSLFLPASIDAIGKDRK